MLKTIEQLMQALTLSGDGTLEGELRQDARDLFEVKQNPELLKMAADFMDIRAGKSPNGGRLTSLGRDHLVRAAVTLASFPDIFATVIDRKLEAAYQTTPNIMRQVCRVTTGADFRARDRYTITGGSQLLEVIGRGDAVRELDKPGETKKSYKVKKYGKKFTTSWEDLVDDASDMNVFDRLPDMLGVAAVATEEDFLCRLFMGASGWDTTYFATANGGAAPLSVPLTVENLKAAVVKQLSFTTPTDALPMAAQPKILMVCPALSIDAMQIVNSTELRKDPANTGTDTYGTRNVLQDLNLRVVVNPWIPKVMTSGTVGLTAWALFTDPSSPTLPIPAAEFGLLRGFERPQIYMKRPDQMTLAGGAVGNTFGSFDTMSIEWKILHVFGGLTLDGRAAVASNGQ